MLFLKLYIGSLLLLNLDTYVEEHNSISKSIFMLIGLNRVYFKKIRLLAIHPFFYNYSQKQPKK